MNERTDPEPQRREFSVERENDLVAITIGGPTPERLLFAPEEARKLLLEIEHALNSGYGRDMDAIRLSRQ
ncbi:hypothetical protein [Methylocella sp. CPCC 101449]|uniref:hypothetical protein n=1 Tax=Methylocella sp. CPCC 101449 TaxID=2987531 RepID=UPI0028925077|nr:hypothetical protein [Methylocella sp. CPCC 101449]MDT2024602.1 hypothetical protein [Methylocella sp. CPCC 101449]